MADFDGTVLFSSEFMEDSIAMLVFDFKRQVQIEFKLWDLLLMAGLSSLLDHHADVNTIVLS